MSSTIRRLLSTALIICLLVTGSVFAEGTFELPQEEDLGLLEYEPLTRCPAGSIVIAPGDDAATLIASAEGAEVYCFEAGIHQGVSIVPNSGDEYLGVEDAILDGAGSTVSAFRSVLTPNAPNPIVDVTIRGLTIQNYTDAPTYRERRSPRAAVEGNEGWIIEHNVIQDNMLGIGLGFANWGWGDGTVIRSNRIINNSYMGIESNGSNIVFEHNELAGNGWGLTDEERVWSGGGSKFTDQSVFADDTFDSSTMVTRERGAEDRLTIRYNWIQSNLGHGIWLDVDNRHALVAFNVFENNYGSGLFDELSTGTTVRNNIFRHNRFGNESLGYWGGGEILIANSQEGEVYHNDITVAGTSRGVVMIYETARADWPFRNYVVRDNVFRLESEPRFVTRDLRDVVTGGEMLGGTIGGWGEGEFYSQGNRFESNTYLVPEAGLSYFYWGARMTWDAFQAAGMEVDGECRVVSSGADC